jgi:hypothetical protein
MGLSFWLQRGQLAVHMDQLQRIIKEFPGTLYLHHLPAVTRNITELCCDAAAIRIF